VALLGKLKPLVNIDLGRESIQLLSHFPNVMGRLKEEFLVDVKNWGPTPLKF
jgi:hypothetical protein